ncbi:MAG: DUF111 family protein, partial [Oscillospiraceae bacterium]|nr:DUF111 family protein [Oscillospiraceae bacterium]
MKILYIECNMGISGDMLMGALYELCDRKEQFIEKMNSLRPLGVTLEPVDDVKLSVSGTHMRVMINGAEEGEAAAHESTGAEGHRHDHHDHRHYSMGDIVNTINSLDVSEKVKTDAINIYKMIADAESTVHGAAVEQVHLHEVGALDAIADVVGNCLLMEMLGADRVCASPIHLGCGQVRCAHGLM